MRGGLPLVCLLAAWPPIGAAASPPPTEATALNDRGVREAQAGRFPEGVELLRQARVLNPEDAVVRRNLSGILTDWAMQLVHQGHVDEAVSALREATTHDSGNGQAFVRLGDILYLRRGEFDAAIDAWTQAHQRVPADVWRSVADRLAQVRRDRLIERGFGASATAHFAIHAPPSMAGALTRLEQALEAAYATLAGALGSGPPKLTVIVYTQEDLRRVYAQRDWALGFYDGRIRLRLDEVTHHVLDDLVVHELAHAFLHHLYGDALPVWLHEGYAQHHERAYQSTGEAARIEQGIVSRAHWIPLKWIDRHFQQPSSDDDVLRAYLQARLVVRELIGRHGTQRFNTFLSRLAQGATVEAAYEQAFAPSRWARADLGHFD